MAKKKKQVRVIAAGTLFIPHSGSCDDYQEYGVLRAKVDIDIAKVYLEWFSLHPEQSKSKYHLSTFVFVEWMLKEKKLAEEVDNENWDLEYEGYYYDIQ